MFHQFFRRLKAGLARLFARLFYQVVDPQIEHELAAPEEYIRMQQYRRMQMERYIARYLGPRV